MTVTRGLLERLSRDEIQGVVAHEFSHILNGDMRLNIRLMGALFGILVLALAGRKVLTGVRISSGGRKQNGGGVALVALALMVVGYVGLFFGRWIKAGVSRQREFLADASAVQPFIEQGFTLIAAGIEVQHVDGRPPAESQSPSLPGREVLENRGYRELPPGEGGHQLRSGEDCRHV